MSYEKLVEDIKEWIGVDDDPEYNPLEDVADHGADAGWPGFTYTSECVEFYQRHHEAIWDVLCEEAEWAGQDNIPALIAYFQRADMATSKDGFESLLAWFALETVARRELEKEEA